MKNKKWLIAIMGTLTHLSLGTVYSWSFFQTPIVEFTNWSNSVVAMTFSLSIFTLGLTAAWGGLNIDKYGAKKLAAIGGVLYGLGYIISAIALYFQNLFLFYIGFGIVGGIGLGLAYVIPVATVSKWFDKLQGLATGMVVMGFGFGALIMSKLLAPFFLKVSNNNLPISFFFIGVVLIIILLITTSFLSYPKSYNTSKTTVNNDKEKIKKYILSKSFIILWLMFMINIIAGMVFISFQSPLLQDLLKVKYMGTNLNSNEINTILATSGATLIAVSSVFNGIGRIFWGTISDKINRVFVFRLLFIIEISVFICLIFVINPIIFSALVCIILLCYGGGFGIAPSLIKDTFGSALMPILYGALLTAWSIGGLIGPQIVAFMKDNYPNNSALYAFIISTILLILGLLISVFYKKPLAE